MKILKQDASWKKTGLWLALIICSTVCLSFLLATNWLFISYQGKFLPGVRLDQQPIGGLTISQAQDKLEQLPVDPNLTIELTANQVSLASTSGQLGLHRQSDQALLAAFQLGRSQRRWTALVEYLRFRGSDQFRRGETVPLTFDEHQLTVFVQALARQANQPISFPSAEKSGGQITIFPGQKGLVVDQEPTVAKLQKLAVGMPVQTTAVTLETGAELTDQEIQAAEERAEQFSGKSLTFLIDKQRLTLTDAEMIYLLGFPLGFHEQHVREQMTKWEQQVKRPGQNAVFEYDPTTLKVTSFQPHRDGWTLDVYTTQSRLLDALAQIERGEKVDEIALELITAEPDIPLSKTNDLGINQRIGFGESYYDHSIASRIHNISNAVEIINNTLVAPGEQFSFNQTLGDVSAATGFKPAYIIQNGQTILGDGGGVCQVSTTTFRALLDSGLNITKRKQHSYRVSYYELDRQPGFDAAVYSGETDLRFINDTDHYVLIHYFADPEAKYMTVEIYGTSDGRTTEITNYRKWDARPAALPVYQDDPTLPAGKVVQIDWAVGGIKAEFTHTTYDKDGNVIRQNDYYSNYIPWSAKYRVGTGT